ncbi:MAG: PorT family protein [Tannerellaceae bacterium]|jgi:hypothetical protein|nr:PorT family protein [Tannerellaceae bacterium]
MNKRFIILLSIVLFVFTIAINGQNTFKKELSIGGSFGMGVSTVSFVPKIQTQFLLGSHIGFTGRWITENHLGLILEVNYTQQGWDEKFEDKTLQYTRKIDVIDVPFLTHIYFGGKRVRFFLNLGPKIGFVINEKTTTNLSGDFEETLDSRYRELHAKLVEKKFAWGIGGGPGIEIRTGIGNFLLEGRYYYGLGDFFNNRKGDPFPQSSSQVIFGKLTYLIPL